MKTLIKNAHVPAIFQPEGASVERLNVLVEDGTIVSVSDAAQDVPAADNTVDASGLTLTPGLIDTHIHLLGAEDLEKYLDWGVTTVAELGTHPDSLVKELKAIPNAPSIISAGSAASAEGSPQSTVMGFPAESVVHGPEDAERFVQWRIDSGSDVIKVIVEDPNNPRNPGLDEETLTALADSARQHNLLSIAHAATVGSYELGLKAGFDILTHAPLEAVLTDEIIERMVEQGTIDSPTIVMMQGFDKAFKNIPNGSQTSLSNTIESVRKMHEAGVPIILGTDANETPASPSQVPHGKGLHQELTLLVESGLTPTEAIHAATLGAAQALRLDDRGRLQEGQRADLTLFSADPTDAIENSEKIAQVWINGTQVR